MKKTLEQANNIIRNLEEDLEIVEMIKERKEYDNGKRYTLDEIEKEFGLDK